MFKAIRQRWRDIGTMKSLCFGAERIAIAQGRTDPGAEDFLLSALDLPDGTARNAFLRAQADPNGLKNAIEQQYADALRSVGIVMSDQAAVMGEAPAVSARKLPKASPSGQALINAMIRDIKVHEEKTNPAAPLLGAHVVLAAMTAQQGVVARALHVMSVDKAALAKAAREEIGAYRV